MAKRPLTSVRLHRINEEIHVKEVRLVGADGDQLGVVSISEALQQGRDQGLDLVELSAQSVPPVCRLMEYGKYLYEKNKSAKEQRKKQKIIHVKEVKFRPGTEDADFQVKLRNVVRFLEAGDKVKVTVRFRGRELVHQQLGFDVLHRIKEALEELAAVETFPSRVEGRQAIMVLAPKKRIALKQGSGMQKQKSVKAAAKRFKVRGSGSIKHKQANLRHLLSNRTTKRKRNLRPCSAVAAVDRVHVAACLLGL